MRELSIEKLEGISGGNNCSNWDNILGVTGLAVSGWGLASLTLVATVATGGLFIAAAGLAISVASIASCNGVAPKL
jgi:hypothetical protein